MKYLVMTTINPPTDATHGFGEFAELEIVVVGDQKTPDHAYGSEDSLRYLSLTDQSELDLELSAFVPLNHYCRKNLGYLYAIKEGAQVIAESDDDNVPYDDWPKEYALGLQANADVVTSPKVVNIYKFFSDEHIWPRGYPLTQIRSDALPTIEHRDAHVMIWQGLADLDPDVDAIFRMVLGGRDIRFARRNKPVVLDGAAYAPFNSQNTVWSKDAFMYLYLPMFVRFRFTDILRGYVAQRGIRELGGSLAFGNASVYQHRNPHNLLRDFEDEVDCYTRIEDVIDALDSCALTGDAGDDLATMYSTLLDIGVVEAKELQAVRAWVSDVTALSS